MNIPSRAPGRYAVLVSGTAVEQKGANGNWCVVVYARTVDTNEDVNALIWMTEKSMRIARQQLKTLGFDVDTADVGDLHETGTLVGREVEFLAKMEEYPPGKFRLKWEVPTPKPDLRGLTSQLRAAGSEESRARQPGRGDAPPASRMPGEGVAEAGRSAREDAARNRAAEPPAKPSALDAMKPGDLDDIPF